MAWPPRIAAFPHPRLPAIPFTLFTAAMSLDSVQKFFAEHAPDIAILVTDASSATVAEAAAAHGVEPAQIAKTLSLRVGGRTFLVVTGGLSLIHI